MCSAPKTKTAPPPLAPPPTLEQVAPEVKKKTTAKKREGLSRYKIGKSELTSPTTQSLGGIPTSKGV